LVTSVLAAMLIFQLITLDQTVWFTNKVNKWICSFLWDCKDEGTCSKCLVNSTLVSLPKHLGWLAVDAPKDVEKIEVLQKRERFARQTVSLRLKAVVQSV
jgi:hypothetical protein